MYGKIRSNLTICRNLNHSSIRSLVTTLKSRSYIATGAIMSKPVVFMSSDAIPDVAKQLLGQKFELKFWPGDKPLPKEILKQQVAGVYGIFLWGHIQIDDEVVKAAGQNLKVVSAMSAGYDHIDVPAVKRAGVRVGHTPNVLTEAVAELGVSLLLATSRRVLEGALLVQNRQWPNGPYDPLWMCGQGLEDSTVGIIGLGHIGCSIATKLRSFCCDRLLYTSREEKSEGIAFGGEWASIDVIMKESDFIVVTLSLNDSTRGIINKERINSMKPNAIFINISRGGVVDQAALTEALQKKKIAGAGLDVLVKEPIDPNDPLLKLDNVVITPHIASATVRARTAMAAMAAKNILAVFEGKEMPAEVLR